MISLSLSLSLSLSFLMKKTIIIMTYEFKYEVQRELARRGKVTFFCTSAERKIRRAEENSFP